MMVWFSKLITMSLALSSATLADAVTQCCTCGSSDCEDEVEQNGVEIICNFKEPKATCQTMRDLTSGWHCDGGYDCGSLNYLPVGHKNRDNCCPLDSVPDIAGTCSTNPEGRCFSLINRAQKYLPDMRDVCREEYKGAICGSGGWGFHTRRSFAGGELGIGLL
jgi:hypothetical protein